MKRIKLPTAESRTIEILTNKIVKVPLGTEHEFLKLYCRDDEEDTLDESDFDTTADWKAAVAEQRRRGQAIALDSSDGDTIYLRTGDIPNLITALKEFLPGT